MNDYNQKDKEYVVVIQAGSRLRFNPGESLQVQVNIGEHRCLMTYQTRYREEGFESPVPRGLWIDARGTAPSLNSAIETFTNASQLFVNLISFSTNAYAGESEFHLAFDNTSGLKEREFFQQFIKEERELPPLSRKIKPELVNTLIDVLGKHENKDRLIRAIVQYVLALGYWKRGSEILATAHLYMGMESLVPVIRRVELVNRGLNSTQELADCWGIPLDNLDSRIRRDNLFQADYDCHRDAKRASDGVEHGYLSFDEIRPLAQDVRDKTATYLRTAIIRLLHLPETAEHPTTSGRTKIAVWNL